MEHIMQIAISFDDEAVTQRVEAKAEQKILSDLEQAVINHVFQVNDYFKRNADPERDQLSQWAEERFDAFLEAHKDEIIQMGGKYLAGKLARTKAGKALLSAN